MWYRYRAGLLTKPDITWPRPRPRSRPKLSDRDRGQSRDLTTEAKARCMDYI